MIESININNSILKNSGLSMTSNQINENKNIVIVKKDLKIEPKNNPTYYNIFLNLKINSRSKNLKKYWEFCLSDDK